MDPGSGQPADGCEDDDGVLATTLNVAANCQADYALSMRKARSRVTSLAEARNVPVVLPMAFSNSATFPPQQTEVFCDFPPGW